MGYSVLLFRVVVKPISLGVSNNTWRLKVQLEHIDPGILLLLWVRAFTVLLALHFCEENLEHVTKPILIWDLLRLDKIFICWWHGHLEVLDGRTSWIITGWNLQSWACLPITIQCSLNSAFLKVPFYFQYLNSCTKQ